MNAIRPAAKPSLVEVRCRNGLCPFYLRKGTRQLVGRINGRAELRCPSCRKVETYEVVATITPTTYATLETIRDFTIPAQPRAAT